ncbi:MAG: radical SAM protein [Candidatus Omnitrophica bacterium]|nr:radical SAM protein [Candidatus Omnitrophota bacterium]
MKVLLVAPTVDTSYERVPNIGLMNLHLIGKELGCEMELMDLTEVPYQKGLSRILAAKYDLIGVSCNFTNAAPYCIRYGQDIKKKYPDTLVISGGNHATLVPEDLLFNGYDYVISGEGELTFREFLSNCIKGFSQKDLKGLCYARDNRIVKNPPQQPVEDLDTLPFNDYSEFNLEPYFKHSGLRYMSMETSRGCIYNCAFCSTVRMWGHNYRHKSPQRILDEFKVAKKLKLDFVFIEDDDVAIDEQNLRNFCKLLIKENLNILWGTTINPRSIKDDSTLDLMKESKCIKVNICIESANPRLLKEYRKPYTVNDNRLMCKKLLSRGFLIHNHGIIGFPNETIRESLNTYFYLIKNAPMWHISVLEPRPGTDYWKKWDKQHDVQQYRLFGKAEVILGKHKVVIYLIYRIFALCYFLNPARIYKALFSKNKSLRYNYRVQYYVAYRTLKANLFIFLKKCFSPRKK